MRLIEVSKKRTPLDPLVDFIILTWRHWGIERNAFWLWGIRSAPLFRVIYTSKQRASIMQNLCTQWLSDAFIVKLNTRRLRIGVRYYCCYRGKTEHDNWTQIRVPTTRTKHTYTRIWFNMKKKEKKKEAMA